MRQQQQVAPIRPRVNPRPAPGQRPDTAHTYHDLTPTGRRGDIDYFTAAGGSTSGKANTVAYPTDDTTLCDCYAAECGRACWHVRLVREAWLVRMAHRALAGCSNEEPGRLQREASALLAGGSDAEQHGAIHAAIADE